MDKCKTCGKELIHEKGKRKKEYCGNTCRSSYWVKVNKKPKVKTIPIKEWEEIQKKLKGISDKTENKVPEQKEKQISIKKSDNDVMPENLNWKEKLDWKRNH